MMKPIWIQALNATSFLVVVAALTANAQAELVKQPNNLKQQAIVEDAITPEADEAEEEVVIVRKAKPKTVVKRVTREETEITPPLSAELPAEAVAPIPPASKPSMGSQLDEGIKTKMVDVQSQFEQALLKTLDRIKITVDDGTAPQGSSTPTDSAVIEDSFVGAQGANDKNYMPVDAAPVMDDEDEEFDHAGSSVATVEKPKSERKVRIAPLFGRTSIGSSAYNISPRYTAGFEIEMDVDKSFAMVLGYSYSQYDISLGSSGSFNNYYQPYGYNSGVNNNSLEYNQNVFSGGMRVYMMPPEAKFRIFGGAGVGYNVGYLNYRSNASNPYGYQYNPYYTTTTDYEVKSWLGLLEAGALFNISESVSLGALFKYALVFSSSENAPLNNYAFVGNNFGYGRSTDKDVVGGSLARDNFYSILGTVKVAF